MAAKKKSSQVTDEPVVVEEVQEDTKRVDTTHQDTTDTPAPDDAGSRPDVTDNDTDKTNEAPAQEMPVNEEPEIVPTTVKEPANAMEEHHDAERTQPAQANDFFGAPPDEAKGGIPKTLIAIALLVVAGGAAAYMFLGGGGQFLGANTEASPSPAVEETMPSPEPSPEIEDADLTEFSVRVLNGTGTAGEAGKVKALLEEAGFEEVGTGNAPSEDNTVTTISAKADVPASAIKAVENALKGSYKTEVGDTLAEDSDYDIVVTTGDSSSKDATGSAKQE